MKDTVKKNKNAQALVEFVLILPIIIMIIFIIIDFSNILYQKNHLEGTLSDVTDALKKTKNTSSINNILTTDTTCKIKKDGKYLKITLEKDVELLTPFANIFFDNPYKINAERVILNE